MINEYLDYRLCYIEELNSYETYRIYFTNKFEGQQGKNWNSRPSCCLSSKPYTKGRDIYSIIISIEGFNTITFGGRTYSVDDMNTKKACWLIFNSVFFEGGEALTSILNKIKTHNELNKNNKVIVFTQFGDEINANTK